MSIGDCIQECIDGDELVELLPLVPSAICLRRVLVSYHVLNFLKTNNNLPTAMIKKAADTRVALDRFTGGAVISVAMNPFDKPVRTQLARVNVNDAVWSFRIRDPIPQIRVFGRFAMKDTFIALHYAPRENLNFPAAVATTKRLWTDLFDNLAPVTGDNINEYLSDKYELV